MSSKLSRQPEPQRESFLPKPDTTDNAIAGVQMGAGALGAIGALAPVPFIKDAADAVLYITAIVKDVKNNQEEFRFIAQDCQLFVSRINAACARIYEEQGKLPDDLEEDLKEFVDTLNKIKGYAKANTHRRRLTRWFYKNLDPETIRRCREELANRFQAFVVQSSIQTRVDLAAVRVTTNKILANLEDKRGSSDPNIPQAAGSSSMLSPPPTSAAFRQRPTSAPPTDRQFSPLPSPDHPHFSDDTDPFSHMRHPNFPFNNDRRPVRNSQPVFNVNTSSNFNAPNSANSNSGNVSTHFNTGADNYAVTYNNYTYDRSPRGFDSDSVLATKLNKANGKVGKKLGGGRRRSGG